MGLSESHARIKPAVAAVVSHVGLHPNLPHIIGTGFVAHEAGLIVTNDHVLDALWTSPRIRLPRGERCISSRNRWLWEKTPHGLSHVTATAGVVALHGTGMSDGIRAAVDE